MAEGVLCQALRLRPRWWSEPCARRFIPKLAGARMLLPWPFHLPTSIGRTFFQTLPAMPRPTGLKAVCAQATVRNGLFCDSPRAFHHIIAANSANRCRHLCESLQTSQRIAPTYSAKRHGLFNETLQPFLRNATACPPKRDTGRSRVSPCAPPGAWMSRL